MSATNTTTNYSLPIFISSDKPAWLVDFNGAMNAIDAQMKTNADAIATKSPILTFDDTTEIDFTRNGNTVTANLASGVSDKVGRALVTPVAAPAAEQIVAIDTNGSQAALEIGSGLFNDSGTLKAIDLNLTDLGSGSASGFPTNVSRNDGQVQYAFNSDKSVGKIYGTISVKKSTSGNSLVEFNTGIRLDEYPESEYTISPVGFAISSNSVLGWVNLKVKTDGYVYITDTWIAGSNATTYISIIPSILFFKDFGDTPINP